MKHLLSRYFKRLEIRFAPTGFYRSSQSWQVFKRVLCLAYPLSSMGILFPPMLVQMLVISTTGFPASAVNYSSGKFTSFATFCWLKVLAIVASFQQKKKPIQKNLPQNWQIEWIKEQQVVGNGWTGGQAIFLAMDKQAIDRQTDGRSFSPFRRWG